ACRDGRRDRAGRASAPACTSNQAPGPATSGRGRHLRGARACTWDQYNEPWFFSSSDATLLRRAASVVRDGRHVDDVDDLVADVVQRTNGGLPTRTRALDAHFQRLHAVVEGGLAGLLRGDLGSERGRLARAAETRATRSRPRQRIALAVGDRDDGVVERSVDVGDAV